MVEYRYPGVYVEEISSGSHPIEGVSTSTAGFVGVSGRGPLLGPLTSFVEFEQAVTSNAGGNLALALRGFFDNGGQRCFVSQIAPVDPLDSGLGAFDGHDVSVVCCPEDVSAGNAAAMTRHCEARKDRVCVLQAAQTVVPVATHRPSVQSSYAAYYHPWLEVPSLDRASKVMVPPCGHIAGVYAKTDTERGVWKAPANEVLVGVTGLSQEFNEADSEALNVTGVDVIRKFAAQGIRVWGARTTSPHSEWKYVNVRRLFIYVEQSLYRGLQWVVFEPNDAASWIAVRTSIENFLRGLWRAGGLQGTKPDEAFFVKCDRDTMTQDDIDNGRLICVIGIAPVKPAEFVLLRVGIWMAKCQ
jgi:phage tail sheath protein FI